MISKARQHFLIERDTNDIVTVWIDVAHRSMNVFHSTVIDELEDVIGELETDGGSAVIFRSGKASGFFAGADVRQIAELSGRDEVDAVIRRGQELFARVERLPMPTTAAIHGPCLGGGLEFALACNYRVAMDNNATKLGLPEIQLGLIPGWGGTQRLPRKIGLLNALPMILEGRKLSANAALKVGLVDAVADASAWEDLLRHPRPPAVKHPDWKNRWTRIATDSSPGRACVLHVAEKKIAQNSINYPALPAAIRAVRAAFESTRDGYDVERDEFTDLIETPTCRNLLNLFVWRDNARSAKTGFSDNDPKHTDLTATDRLTNSSGSKSRLAARPPFDLPNSSALSPATRCRLGVMGAGAMGAGIGQLAALKGFEVVLKELNTDLANAGMKRVTKLLDAMVTKKRLSGSERDDVLKRITVTDRFEDMSDCDVVIEAVVEKMDVKKAVFASLDAVLKSDAVIVSNTSALSVSEMATATKRPDRVAGLHFFNPVHRMDLVEVVRTPNTSEDTVDNLLRLIRKLGKTPVVTSDSPGFLVNRVLFPYIGEAVRMVMEDHNCRDLDREVRRFGMPMGPIELIDHVGIDVAWHVAETLESVLPESTSVIHLLGQMVARGWTGCKSGRGFYEYVNGKRGAANADIRSLVAATKTNTNIEHSPAFDSRRCADDSQCVHPTIGAFLDDGLTDVQRRLIYPMINEVGFCMQESVVTEPWMADLAMILGTGFAPFRGGPMTLANSIGQPTLLNNLHVLSARLGERFKPSAWLVHAGSRGGRWGGDVVEENKCRAAEEGG